MPHFPDQVSFVGKSGTNINAMGSSEISQTVLSSFLSSGEAILSVLGPTSDIMMSNNVVIDRPHKYMTFLHVFLVEAN